MSVSVGPDPIWLVSLWEKGLEHRETAEICEHREKTMWGHSKKSFCKPRREVSEGLKPANILVLDS